MQNLSLQQAFSNIPPVVKSMMEFDRRNDLGGTYYLMPALEENGCEPVKYYRINPADNQPGVDKRTEVRSMVFKARFKGKPLIIEVDNRANGAINTYRIFKALREIGWPIKIGDMLNVKEIFGLEEGEINARSVADMAAKKNLPVLLVTTDELAERDEPFSHNAGTQRVGVTFNSSKAFYAAHARENARVKYVDADLPGVIVLPLRLIAASKFTCHK